MDEFEQSLIKSIDTLLEEKSSQLIEHIQDDIVSKGADVWPKVAPKYADSNFLLVDGHKYVKWSTIDSDEQIWPKKLQNSAGMNMNSVAATVRPSQAGRSSVLHPQTPYIAAAMNINQRILNQYQTLLHPNNLIGHGQNINDRLMYSMNPNYPGLGILAASAAINWNIANWNYKMDQMKLVNLLNGLMMQNSRGLRDGKAQPQTSKNHWPVATNKMMRDY